MQSHTIKSRLFAETDASFLTVFRIGFGLILIWEVFRYWTYDWIASMFIQPAFLFKYYGFEWVQPWPGDGMYYHFIALGVLALFIAAGFMYRISAVLFFFAFCFVFLQDQTLYLNHFYMVILYAFLLILMPAHRQFSADAYIRPAIRSSTVPVWSLWMLRAQMEVIYIYAGIVKINSDWLQLQPLRTWLSYRDDIPLIGSLYTQDWAISAAVYGVILLHIVGAPLLLWKKTRLVMFIIYTLFHLLNHFTFSIGIFPWVTILATTVFFDPDWPKQLWRKTANLFNFRPGLWRSGDSSRTEIMPPNSAYATSSLRQNLLLTLIGVWLAYQVFMPARHLLYPGDVNWTEEGHRFAWRMKLRSKRGDVEFIVHDPVTNKSWHVQPGHYLAKQQVRKMAGQPDMILQFAHFLAREWKDKHGLATVEVRVQNFVSLNYRKYVPMIDPHRNLAAIKRNLRPADWILPLTEPLYERQFKTGDFGASHQTDG